MTADVDRIRQWAAQVRADERACTIEQCLDRIDRLLAYIDEPHVRKPPARAVGRAVRDEGRRATGGAA